MITLEKVHHKGEDRIAVHFPKDQILINNIKKIAGCLWSRSKNSWHVPYTKVAYSQLLKVFPEVIPLKKEPVANLVLPTTHPGFSLITKPGGSVSKIINIRIDKKKSKIYLKHPIDKILYAAIMVVKKSKWDKIRKEWSLPGNNENYLLIQQIAKKAGYSWKVETITEAEKEANISIIKYYSDSLKLKNYSQNTLDAYLPYFQEFVVYFGESELDNLSVRQMHDYVRNIIETQKLSEIAIKHLISAIKFYYEKIKGKEKIYFPLQKKYAIEPIVFKIKIEELLPFVNVMKKPGEKLLILLKFHFGYPTEAIVHKTMEEVNRFFQNTSIQKNDADGLLYETLKSYVENTHLKIYLFEKEAGKSIREDELDRHIFSLVSKYKIGIVYKYELNKAMEQLNFETTTRKSYTGCFISFLKHYNFRHPSLITDEEIRKYLVAIRTIGENSSSYLNLAINAINFYYIHIQKRKISVGTMVRPKREKTLPEVISQEEIFGLIAKTENRKHKFIISSLYSLGLRRQELINLKTSDIDFQRNVIIVKQGKGKKDRQVPIPINLKPQIISYMSEFKPGKYLIEGEKKGKYSGTSIENVVKDAAKRAGLTKNVHPHILRHSIATHMLELGTEITIIKDFLGHADLKTTLRYVHVSNKTKQKIRNPFDNIKF